jgi:SAM-dependent methyltransferase
MKWLAKAAVQGAISVLPRSHEINYIFQQRVTKRLPRGPEDFDFHAATAAQHVRSLRRHRPDAELGRLRLYEFGSGWDLIGAVALWSLGANHQLLIDIRDNMRLELVNHTLAQFAARHDALERRLGEPLRRVDGRPIAAVEELEERFGIRYVAPLDARATGFEAGSVDFVTSTFTLEHIPAGDLADILTEIRRLLAPGGLMSSLIDLQDHYSYIDSTLSAYNFLRYSDRTWALLNPQLQWQSRQRYPQYLELFRAAGLHIVAEDHLSPSDADLQALADMPIHPRFRAAGWSLHDLGVRSLDVVAEVRAAPAGAHA